MHYYQFNIGDYRRDTTHLSPIEHYIYRTLIDWYYLDEKPIPKKTQVVMRRLNLAFDEHENSLKNILDDFFIEKDDGFYLERIEKDIVKYQNQIKKNQENGKKGGRPKKNDQQESEKNPSGFDAVSYENPNESEKNPNQEPITNNQEPIKKNNYANEVSEIFDFWKMTFSKNNSTKLSKERKAKVIERLKDGYTIEQIKQAIKNCSMNSYNIENGYTDLELICRNVQKFVRYLELATQQQPAQGGNYGNATSQQSFGKSSADNYADKLDQQLAQQYPDEFTPRQAPSGWVNQ